MTPLIQAHTGHAEYQAGGIGRIEGCQPICQVRHFHQGAENSAAQAAPAVEHYCPAGLSSEHFIRDSSFYQG